MDPHTCNEDPSTIIKNIKVILSSIKLVVNFFKFNHKTNKKFKTFTYLYTYYMIIK